VTLEEGNEEQEKRAKSSQRQFENWEVTEGRVKSEEDPEL
jgi:hypothetical protein